MNKLNISKFGIGCHRMYDGFEAKNSFDIIKTALDNNITHFDTAPRYGDSEMLLGKFLKNEKATVSSKVGLDPLYETQAKKYKNALKRLIKRFLKENIKYAKTYHDNKMCKRYFSSIAELKNNMKNIAPKRTLTEKEIRGSLAQSLVNLQRDALDIYFLHEPDMFINNEEIIYIFNKLKKEGLILNFGLAFHRWITSKEENIQKILTLSMFQECLLTNHNSNSNFAMIHGAMGYYKNKLTDGEKDFYGTPVNFIKNISRLNPNKTFIMSPSNANQLTSFV